MAIQARLADGRVLSFPDGTDPEVINRTVKSMIAAASQQAALSPVADAVQLSPEESSAEGVARREPKPERKVYTGSVFDTQPFDPKFDPEEAARLSRRDYAERGAQQPRRTQFVRATPQEQIERSAGRAVADTLIQALQGANAPAQMISANILAGDNPITEYFKSASEAGERSKSPFLQSQKAEREALLKNVLENQGELAQTRAAFTSMFSPAGADIVVQGAGSILPTVGMSLLGLGARALKATNALSVAGEAAQNTARELSQMSPQEWSKSDAYQELRGAGLSHSDAVRMLAPLFAVPSQLVGGGAGFVSGGTGLEKSLAGKAITGGTRERAGRAGAEVFGEQLETLAPSLAGNITQRLIDEKTSLTENLGREAVETLFGAAPGAALAATGRSGPEAPRELDTRGLADRMARQRGFLAPEARTERPAPAREATQPAERVEPTFNEQAFIEKPVAKPADELTQQRAQEQADVLALEGEPKRQLTPVIQNSSSMQAASDYFPEIIAPALEAVRKGNFKPVVLKNGTQVNLVVSQDEENMGGRVIALDQQGQEVGQLMFTKVTDEQGNAYNPQAFVNEGLRRQGLATALYDLAEEFGAKIPELDQYGQIRSDEGQAFRRARAGLPAQDGLSAEETPQQKLRRLSSKSIGMTNAFRDRAITNQEYEKFKADLEAARQEANQAAPDISTLSPAKQEILEIADRLEAAGVKDVADGMRLAARPRAPEPNEKNMEFYRSKLQPYEEAKPAAEKVSYGLPEFFSDSEKEAARITGLMESGPLKTRVALNEANDSIKRLADTIQAAGFDINNLVKGQVPDGIMKIKSQIGNIAARSNRLAAATEAVQKKYKRADPQRVKNDAANLMADVEEADNLIAEDQNIPSAAEQMEGVAPPDSLEVEELMRKQRLAAEDIEILSKRSAGTSLMKVLEGSLRDGEMSELAGRARKIGKNPFISLVAKKGKRGSSMEDMVDSGKLDAFLPYAMRPGQPNYDNGEAAEYIREKLRVGEFYTDDIRTEIDNIQRGIWDIEGQIEEELSLEEINREIQYAVDEQRALDQEAAPAPAEGAPEAPEGGAREEAVLKTQTEEELRAKQDEIDRLRKENERLAKEAEEKAKADEEVGDFVLTGSKRDVDEAEARGQQTFLNISKTPVTGEPAKRAPSVTRRAKTLSRAREQGKISDMEFVIGVNDAIEAAENAKMQKERPERQRGADFIRQKLLEAKRRGDLSDEASDLAEWFILNNPALVDDLGISIRMKKAEGTAGQYIPFSRIMVLMKGAANDQTPVHEILHHLERMMPANVQSAIRKEWAKQLAQAKQKAATPDERKFFELLFRHHYHENGSQNDFDKAVELIQDGKAPYEFYQYVNPSEFWAVNGSDIMQGRFDAVRGGMLQRLKNWLKELGQKVKSIFGVPSNAPLLRALDSLSKGDGNFVTKEMLGEATGYAAIAGKNIFDQKPLANWTMPDSTNLDSFIYFMQNKQIDMKRAVDAIKDNIGKIDERFDPYMKETLFAGRAATQTKRFLQNEVEPLFKEMSRLDVNMPELEEYLQNRHAQERNEQIAKVNPGMPDKGSGIETADAKAYLAGLTPEQEAKYKKLAGMVDAITAGTRQLLVDSGLESQDTIDVWESTYDNYVPLNREDVDYSSNHGMGVGQGYSVRGPASRRAVGSERQVVDILANIVMQRERNIVRAEKNRVAMALYGMAIQNPNPEFFLAVNPDAKKDIAKATQELVDMGFLPSDINSLMKEPSTMEIDPKTGLAIERVHQMQRGADNVMALRVNGENRYVFFNQNNERAKRMATAIKNLDADKLGFILGTTADITRFLASMNTQYNPIFGAYNFLRDVSTAGLQLTNTPLAGKQKEVLKPSNVFGAMRGIYKDLRAERGGKAGTSEWSKLWEEFQQRGGQTGFRDQFSSTAKRGEALQRIVDPSSWADQGLGKVFTAGGKLKVPMEVARKAAAPIFNWLSDYNETMENAIRLSAYKTALDNGMSKDAAAVLAKELTVNFNRKGQVAAQAGALYAFFNASVQGTTALIRTLSGPAGKAIIGGGLMLGGIQAMLYSLAGFDEGEPPEFIREKNFVMPIGNGKYVAIPLPLGYNVIPNTARLITEDVIRFTQGKKIKPVDTAFKVFESLLGSFNPIGNAGWSFQTAAPTVADPIVAIMENRDWTGKKIAREDFNALDPTPGFTRYKESSTSFGRALAEFMNSMSGGTEDAPGRISPTPDQIDYLVGQIFGGVGREAMKIERTIRSRFTGEELPAQAIPIAGRFYGDTKGSSAVSNAFYENLKQMNIHENTVKGMRKRKENVQEYFRDNPEARMFEEAGRVEREVQALRKRRRELVEKKAPKESVRAIEERITARMKRFNDKVKQREEKKN